MGPKKYKRVKLDQIPNLNNVTAAAELKVPVMLLCGKSCRASRCKTFAYNEGTGICKLYMGTLEEMTTESEEGTNIWIEIA